MPVLLQFAQKNDQLELMTRFAFKSTPALLLLPPKLKA